MLHKKGYVNNLYNCKVIYGRTKLGEGEFYYLIKGFKQVYFQIASHIEFQMPESTLKIEHYGCHIKKSL